MTTHLGEVGMTTHLGEVGMTTHLGEVGMTTHLGEVGMTTQTTLTWATEGKGKEAKSTGRRAEEVEGNQLGWSCWKMAERT